MSENDQNTIDFLTFCCIGRKKKQDVAICTIVIF